MNGIGRMIIIGYFAFATITFSQTPRQPQIAEVLHLARYDLNGNGRIDIEERTKEFVREQSRLRLESAKEHAAQRGHQGGLKLDDLKLSSPNRAQFIAHDANGNGQLEPEERIRLEATLREELVRRFHLADVNGDGVLDRNEARSMRVGFRSSGSPKMVNTPAP